MNILTKCKFIVKEEEQSWDNTSKDFFPYPINWRKEAKSIENYSFVLQVMEFNEKS